MVSPARENQFGSRRAPPFVLALDVGSSSCRASLYDALGRRVPGTDAQMGYLPRFTPDGGAELDPDALLEVVGRTIDRASARAGLAFAHVAAVAISTFWHSLMGVDSEGNAATPLMLWMDARSRGAAATLRGRIDEQRYHARSGCFLHWSYWPAKLVWLQQAQPARFSAARGWMSFGAYLAQRLFGTATMTISDASATGLFNQHTSFWDAETVAELPIGIECLPPLAAQQPLHGPRAAFATRWPALRAVPWFPALGDGACSNIGAGCTTRKHFALMVGTSGAMRALWRADHVAIPWGVWCYRADQQRYVLGGALNDGGSLFTWLRNTLRLPSLARAEAAVATLEPDGHGLTILPLWGGERSPGWADDAQGAIVGLRLGTSSEQVLRAALEAVALRFVKLDTVLRRVLPETVDIVATGGALLRSPAWLQIMADALGRSVYASTEPEASSRGAALMALEWLGRLPGGIESLAPPVGPVYEPVMAHTERYRAAAERQDRLYELLVAQGAGSERFSAREAGEGQGPTLR